VAELTPSQTIGPFFAHALPYIDGGNVVLPGDAPRIAIEITVRDGAGAPVPDALLECWQADSEGRYHEGCEGFGRAATDDCGVARFTTAKPGPVKDAAGIQAPHIALSVFARGVLTRLVTRVYFDDEPPSESDRVFSSVPEHRRATLLARGDGNGNYRFDLVLQGERETVFFDV
jgi:protocatechuate 3,4-dioxygenase, alpha subunit